MFKDISMTGSGLGLLALMFIIQWFDLKITEEEAQTTILVIGELIGVILTYIGQYRRKDLVYGLKRKVTE